MSKLSAWHWAVLAAVAVVGLGMGVAAVAGRTFEVRKAAQAGVLLAGVTSWLALRLKRRAVERGDVRVALGVLVSVFMVRVAVAVGGAAWVMKQQLSTVAYTLGFFGAYFPLQWLEIGFVVAAAKKRGSGGV